jgi:hypothetical protein
MPRPRIAILFSGQPRCVDGLSYQAFKTCLLDRYDVDVYAHFWGDIETDKSAGTATANLERFKELYSPKAIRVDPPLRADEFPLPFLQPHSPTPLTRENILTLKANNWAYWVRNCVSMYTSMGRVYDLFKTHGGDYDWIIRTRTDCVLLRCPDLANLERNYLYAPQWHGRTQDVIVNHALIVPPSLALGLFGIRETLEQLPGKMDEDFIFHRLKTTGTLQWVRTIPLDQYYPTLTRDGIQTDKPEPAMAPMVVAPPYTQFVWDTVGTSAWKKIQFG